MTRPRRKTPTTKPVLRCPQCGSVNLVYEAGLITGQKYHCIDCNYIGPFVVEEDAPLTDDAAKG